MDRFDSKDEGSFRAANSLRTDGRSSPPDFLIGSCNYSLTAIVSVTGVTDCGFRKSFTSTKKGRRVERRP